MASALIVQAAQERKTRPITLIGNASTYIQETWHASTAKAAISAIRRHEPTVVILDVHPALGIDFEVFEATKDIECKRLIICESDNMMMKAIRYNVDEYLVRPVTNEQIRDHIEMLLFRKKLHSIQQLFHDQSHTRLAILSHMRVSSLNGQQFVDIASLLRVEDHGEFCRLSLDNGRQILTPWSMNRLLNRLHGNRFLSTSPSMAINCRHIQDLKEIADKLHAIMSDGYAVPVPILQEESIRKLMREVASQQDRENLS